MPLGVAKDLAAILGFVTAVIGFGKLVYEGWSSISDLLPSFGAAY